MAERKIIKDIQFKESALLEGSSQNFQWIRLDKHHESDLVPKNHGKSYVQPACSSAFEVSEESGAEWAQLRRLGRSGQDVPIEASWVEPLQQVRSLHKGQEDPQSILVTEADWHRQEIDFWNAELKTEKEISSFWKWGWIKYKLLSKQWSKCFWYRNFRNKCMG